MLLRVGSLPADAIAASAAFHAAELPKVLAALAGGPKELALVFASADHTHRAWRLAIIQGLAREHAPQRINAIASDDDMAIAEAASYLGSAEGVTGQLLELDSRGAGEVVCSPDDTRGTP